MLKKVCRICKIEKFIIEFPKRKDSKEGYRNECKKCKALQDRNLYFKNRDARLKKQQEYKEPRREELAKKQREYYKKHSKERIQYETSRMRNDILYKLKNNLRCRLNRAIKNNYKSGSAVKDLGCSIEEFKTYMELLFQEGMSWSNHGVKGWHIDHIIPLASFDLADREQLKKACHYTNLQPLWAIDNYKKSKRRSK